MGFQIQITVDEFNKHNLKIFGPSKKYALLEGSKVFSKEFMKHYDIPTADYQMFSSENEAKDFIPGGVNSPVRAFNGVGGDPIFLIMEKAPIFMMWMVTNISIMWAHGDQ